MSKKRRGSIARNLDVKRALLLSSPFWLAAVASQDLSAVNYNATDEASLRTAIDNANGGTTDDVIELAAGTYNLTGAALDNSNASGDLDITKAQGNLTIEAATGATVIIDGGSNVRVFHINAGANVTVTIRDLTVQNGQATDNGSTAGQGRGGGILLEQGGLTLENVTLDSNTAQGAAGTPGSDAPPAQGFASNGTAGGDGGNGLGGAVYVGGGTVQVTGSTLSNNAASGGAGGIGGAGGDATTTQYTAAAGDGATGGAGATGRGGAIYVAAGAVTISESTLDTNSATGGTGGAGGAGGDADGTNSSTYPLANAGTGGGGGAGGAGEGGGIYAAGGTVDVTGSTLKNNSASGGTGGAAGAGGNAFADGQAGTSAHANGGDGGTGGAGADARGGAVFANAGTVSIVNSTISGNSTTSGDGGAGGDAGTAVATNGVPNNSANDGSGGNGGSGGASRGGGIAVLGGTLDIDNATVASNTCAAGSGGTGGSGGGTAGTDGAGQGGGVFNNGATMTMDSSIVGDNDDGSASNDTEDHSGAATVGASLIEVAPTSSTITPGTGANVTGQDAQLSALANNGGPTETQAIASGSPAENAGSNPLSLTTDQRGTGYNRDDGNGVDMGAFELQSTVTTPPSVSDPSAATTVNAASYDVQGTAPADSLVRIYSDANNNGVIDGADAVVAQQQLTGGATNFSISVTLTQDVDNDFTATADDGTSGESNPVDVPTITEDSTAPTTLTVTDPASATNTTGTTYDIQGTTEADALVQVYSDFNNNGVIDGADAVVANQQLTGGATTFSITTPITQSTTNNFTVTATDGAGNESNPVDVPTITETTAPPIAAPTVTDPAGPVTVDLANYTITGTAQADALVRIYSDLNNDGFINGADAVVGQEQLTGGATDFSISVPLTQDAANDFLATADDGVNESLPTDVPTITDNNAGSSSGGGGGGGDGGGCSTDSTPKGSWMLLIGALAALAAGFRSVFRRRREEA